MRTMAWGLAATYVLMVVLHLFRNDAHTHYVGLPSSVAGMLVFTALGLALHYGWKPSRPNTTVGLIALGIVGNITLNYVSDADPSTAAMFVMAALGIGALLNDLRWVAVNLAAILCCWLGATILAVPSDTALRDGLALVSAAVIGVVIHLVRIRSLRSMERLKTQAETRRKDVESAAQALERSQWSLLTVVENNPDGNIVIRDGTILFVNRTLCDDLHYQGSEELIGAPLSTLMSRDSNSSLGGDFRISHPDRVAELRFLRRDGAELIMEGASREIEWEGSAATLLVVRDVTARHQELHARLMMSDRLLGLGRLASGVAHEVNNPLTVVLSNLQALESSALSDDGREHLEEAMAGVRRVQRVMRDLQRFTQTPSDNSSHASVEELVAGAMRLVHHDLRHRAHIQVETRAHPIVKASAAELGQVFVNLLLNALEALDPETDAAQTIRVLIDASESAAIVEIQDPGCGMTPAVLGRIFEPFFTTKSFATGTGLGLHYCRSIVEQLGGTIEVKSRPGAGSTFRVLIPRTASSPSLDESHAFSLPVLRIMIVDDEPAVARALRRLLKRHDVTIAEPGEAVVGEFLDGAYDVMLCDLMMPQLTGKEVYTRIAAKSASHAARIVFVTGGAFTESMRAFLDKLNNPVLEKPVDPTGLKSALIHVMAESERASRT